MARHYNGTNQLHTASGVNYLSGVAGAFTIALWLRPETFGGGTSNKHVLRSGTGANYWGLIWDFSESCVEFFQTGGSGTDPRTGSLIGLSTRDVAFGTRILYRHAGTGGEWAYWKDGVKQVIAGSRSFTLPTLTGNTLLATSGVGSFLNGDLAEVAIWDDALSDSEAAQVTRGMAADMIRRGNLIAYWPLRGNTSNEPNYATAAGATLTAMAPSNTPTSALHPDVYGDPEAIGQSGEPVWCVTLFHASGTRRVSTIPVGMTAREADYLGGGFIGRITNDVDVSESLGDSLSGVIQAADVELEIDNVPDASWSDVDERGATPWRSTRGVIERFDRSTFELVEEFSGKVRRVRKDGAKLKLTLSSHDVARLRRLLPNKVITADLFPSSVAGGDLGKALPVIFGHAVPVRPRHIGFDGLFETDASSGGSDFACAIGTAPRVENLLQDYDSETPGMEALASWDDAPGSPVKVNSNTVSVNDGHEKVYNVPGLPIRWKDDESQADPGEWPDGYKCSFLTAFNSTTDDFTIFDTDIGTNPTGWQIAASYVVEKGRYQVAAGVFLTSVRFFNDNSGGLLALMSDAVSNPSDVCKALLNNPTWGANEPVNFKAFIAGAEQLLNIGGKTLRVAGELGMGGAQRELGEVLNEILSFQGGIAWYSARSDEWWIKWDTAPSAPVLTIEEGGGRNNITETGEWGFGDTSQMPSRLRLNYAVEGRARERNAQFIPGQFGYSITAPVLEGSDVGEERVITSPWIRDFETASRVLAYAAKTTRYSDGELPITVNYDGRRVKAGDLITVVIPRLGINETRRVKAVRGRSLAKSELLTVGYNAAIHTYDPDDTDAQPTEAERDRRSMPTNAGLNLVVNADFTTGLKNQTVPTGSIDDTSLPGWRIEDSTQDHWSDITVTFDGKAVGGAYLTWVVVDPSSNITVIEPGFIALARSGYQQSGGAVDVIAAMGSKGYIVSVYADRVDGWEVKFRWYKSSGGSPVRVDAPPLKTRATERNGFGWKRYYCAIHSPADPSAGDPIVSVQMTLRPRKTGTFKFDAIKFEESGRHSPHPTPWTPNVPFGIDPARLNPGRLTMKPAGTANAGTAIDHLGPLMLSVPGSGAPHLFIETGLSMPPEAIIDGVRVIVRSAFSGTGVSSIGVGHQEDPTAWGTCALAVGSRNAAFFALGGVIRPSATKVRLTALDANGVPTSGGNGFANSSGQMEIVGAFREFIRLE